MNCKHPLPSHQKQTLYNRILTQLKRKKLNKKAITVIMGVALLVSLAVAAGSVFIKLGSAQVESKAECAIDVNLKLSTFQGKQLFCLNQASKQLEFTIDNGVNIKVEGLLINTIGLKKAQTIELNDAKMPKAGSYVGSVKYDPALSGQLRQVKIIPKVKMYDEEQICAEKTLVVEKFPAC